MHRFCLHISGLSSSLCLFAPIQPRKGICREHPRIWNVLERGLILTIHISVMCVSKIGSPYLPYPSLHQPVPSALAYSKLSSSYPCDHRSVIGTLWLPCQIMSWAWGGFGFSQEDNSKGGLFSPYNICKNIKREQPENLFDNGRIHDSV